MPTEVLAVKHRENLKSAAEPYLHMFFKPIKNLKSILAYTDHCV